MRSNGAPKLHPSHNLIKAVSPRQTDCFARLRKCASQSNLWAHVSPQSKRHLELVQLFFTQLTADRPVLFNGPPFLPLNTLFCGPTWAHISIGSAVLGWPFVKRFGLCYRTVVLSVLSCLSACNVGVLWPNGWMDEGKTWRGGRTRPQPQSVKLGPSSSRGA